jgi:hypothetical protein
MCAFLRLLAAALTSTRLQCVWCYCSGFGFRDTQVGVLIAVGVLLRVDRGTDCMLKQLRNILQHTASAARSVLGCAWLMCCTATLL